MIQEIEQRVDTDYIGQLSDTRAEQDYQAARMPSTRLRLRFICAITAFAYLGAIYADSMHISGNEFKLMLTARIITALAASIPFILTFFKNTTPAKLGLYAGIYMSVLMATEACELILKSDMSDMRETPITVIIVLMFYLFQPPQIWQSIIAAGLGSLAYLTTLASMTAAPPDYISNTTLVFALANGFGLYFSISFGAAQRREYTALTELKRKAETDALTSIFNRRRIMELGQREFSTAKRYAHPCSLLLLDIDHFKTINDSHGHAAGDEVLVTLVDRCTENLREADLFGRIGGEEFAIFMPHSTQAQAIMAAKRLKNAISETPFSVIGKTLDVTVSIGVAELSNSMSSLDELFQKVDSALYAAKHKGRNAIHAG